MARNQNGRKKPGFSFSASFAEFKKAAGEFTRDGSMENLQAAYDAAADLSFARSRGLITKNQGYVLDRMALYHQYLNDANAGFEAGDKPIGDGAIMAGNAMSKAAKAHDDLYAKLGLSAPSDNPRLTTEQQLKSSAGVIVEEHARLCRQYGLSTDMRHEGEDLTEALGRSEGTGKERELPQTFGQVLETARFASGRHSAEAEFPRDWKAMKGLSGPAPVPAPDPAPVKLGVLSDEEMERLLDSLGPPPEAAPAPMPAPPDEIHLDGKEHPLAQPSGGGAGAEPVPVPDSERGANIRNGIEQFSRVLHDMNAARMAEQGKPVVPWEEESVDVRQSVRSETAAILTTMRASGRGFDFSKPMGELPLKSSGVQAVKPDGTSWEPRVMDFNDIPELPPEQKAQAEALSKDDIWEEFDRQARALNEQESAQAAGRLDSIRQSMADTAADINRRFGLDTEGAHPMGQTAAAMQGMGHAAGMEPEAQRMAHDSPVQVPDGPARSLEESLDPVMREPLPDAVRDMAVSEYGRLLSKDDAAAYRSGLGAAGTLSRGYEAMMARASRSTELDGMLADRLCEHMGISHEEAAAASAVSNVLDLERIRSGHAVGSVGWNAERCSDIKSISQALDGMDRAAAGVSSLTRRADGSPELKEALQGTLSVREARQADRGSDMAQAVREALYSRVADLEDNAGLVMDSGARSALGQGYQTYRVMLDAGRNGITPEVQAALQSQANKASRSPEGVMAVLDQYEKSERQAVAVQGLDMDGLSDTVRKAAREAPLRHRLDGITRDLTLRNLMRDPGAQEQRSAAGKAYRDFARGFYETHLEPDTAAEYRQSMANASSVISVMNRTISDIAKANGSGVNERGRYSASTGDIAKHLSRDLDRVDLNPGADSRVNNQMLRDMMDKATLLGECSAAGSRVYSGRDGGAAQKAVRDTLTQADGKVLNAVGNVALKMQDEVFRKAAAMELSGQKLDKATKQALGPEYADRKKRGLLDDVKKEYADKGQVLEKPSRISSFMSGVQERIKSMAHTAAREPALSGQERGPDTEAFNRAFGVERQDAGPDPEPRPSSQRVSMSDAQARRVPDPVVAGLSGGDGPVKEGDPEFY